MDLTDWRSSWPDASWRGLLTLPGDPGEVNTFRLATTSGRLLGTDAFVPRMEEETGRRLRQYPVGRPRKDGGEGKSDLKFEVEG